MVAMLLSLIIREGRVSQLPSGRASGFDLLISKLLTTLLVSEIFI